MSQVSKKTLPKRTQDELTLTLLSVLVAISKQNEMRSFLFAFLTTTEIHMLAKRLAIIVLIAEGLKDTEIADALHVTRITIAKTRYFYEARGKDGLDIALSKIERDEQLKKLKKLLISLTRYSIRASGGYVKPKILDEQH